MIHNSVVAVEAGSVQAVLWGVLVVGAGLSGRWEQVLLPRWSDHLAGLTMIVDDRWSDYLVGLMMIVDDRWSDCLAGLMMIVGAII